jgi:hypothetical protein
VVIGSLWPVRREQQWKTPADGAAPVSLKMRPLGDSRRKLSMAQPVVSVPVCDYVASQPVSLRIELPAPKSGRRSYPPPDRPGGHGMAANYTQLLSCLMLGAWPGQRSGLPHSDASGVLPGGPGHWNSAPDQPGRGQLSCISACGGNQAVFRHFQLAWTQDLAAGLGTASRAATCRCGGNKLESSYS